jgi:hypothetical protein
MFIQSKKMPDSNFEHGQSTARVQADQMTSTRRDFLIAGTVRLSSIAGPVHAATAATGPTEVDTTQTRHKTIRIDGIDIFYREAGPRDAPAILLLHGFPSSSHMFRNLIPALADKYHVVAPDYPGVWLQRLSGPHDVRIFIRKLCPHHRPLYADPRSRSL